MRRATDSMLRTLKGTKYSWLPVYSNHFTYQMKLSYIVIINIQCSYSHGNIIHNNNSRLQLRYHNIRMIPTMYEQQVKW